MTTLQENLQFCFHYDATKPNVIENKIREGTDCLKAALSSGMTSVQFLVASAKSVSCWSLESEALLYLVLWPNTDIHSENTVFRTL
jgi:hypothetical protein